MEMVRGFRFDRRGFVAALLLGVAITGCGKSEAPAGGGDIAKLAAEKGIEKSNLKLGFIKLTDIAPLVVAKEKGFFAEEGLNVTLEPQANWKVLLDGVTGGQLDGAHMLAGQPLAAGAGIGAKVKLIAPFSPRSQRQGRDPLQPRLPGDRADPAQGSGWQGGASGFGVRAQAGGRGGQCCGQAVQDGHGLPGFAPHNYVLRYWLAAGGLNPGYYLPGDTAGITGAEVQLSVTPPPQMPATLEAGTINGYSVGEPWNQAAVAKKIGVPIIVDPDIRRDHRGQGVRPDRGLCHQEPQDRAGDAARADPRLDVARCRWRQEPARGGQAARPSRNMSAPTRRC